MNEIVELFESHKINLSFSIDKFRKNVRILFVFPDAISLQKVYNYLFERKIYLTKVSESEFFVSDSLEKMNLIIYYLKIIEKEL